MKLYNSFKSLIVEIASVNSIMDAIKKRQKVVIYYDGDEPGTIRIDLSTQIAPLVFPYAYDTYNANNFIRYI